MDKQISRHHIVPQSRDGTWHENNIVRLIHSYHQDFHRVFGNMTPDEQLRRIVTLSETALTDKFKNNILNIIDSDPNYIYKKGVLIPR